MTTYFNISGMDLPSSIKSDMNTIMKRKLGITENITIPPDDWSSFITYMKPLPEKTASGSIAHFTDGADTVPLKSSKFYITPTQASGTPTPSNPLPITGWTGANVVHAGKNLFDDSNADCLINAYISSGRVVSDANSTTLFLKCNPSTTYTISKTAGKRFVVCWSEKIPENNDVLSGQIVDQQASSITITTGATAKYLVAFVFNSSVDTITKAEMLASIQVEQSATATAYEVYTATTYPVSWSEHGTVYGGYFKDGELWKTHEVKTFTGLNETWFRTTTEGKYTYGTLLPNDCDTSILSTRREIICNIGKYISTGSDNWGCWFLCTDATHPYFYYIPDPTLNIEDSATFRTWLGSNNITVAYPLATPVKVADIDPLELVSFLGVNNIWCDTGDCEVEYHKQTKFDCGVQVLSAIYCNKGE